MIQNHLSGADDTATEPADSAISRLGESSPAPEFFADRVEACATGRGGLQVGDTTRIASPDSSPASGPVQPVEPSGGGSFGSPAAAPCGGAPSISDADIRTATLRRTAVEAYRALLASGVGRKTAARKVGEPWQTLYRWGKDFDAQGFDGLLPKSKNSGRKPKHRLTPQQAADVKSLVLQTNRTSTAGSVPEAVRAGIKRGLLDYSLVELVKARFDAGLHPLTPAMREQVRVTEADVLAYRSPRNAWLKLVQSPGSIHLTLDETTGEEREIEPGEKWTIDDATINFVCCVPFNLPGNKCAENFGVMVGRFQFIVPADHRSYFIPGFNYTARPRSSYRAEDITATLQTVFAEHGYPKAMVLEHGVSAANLISDTLGLLGIRIERAASPHQKVIEGIFNKLWTKLSLMPGQVGRFRGEEEEVQALLTSCQRGATDPRKHFPMLATVLHALKEAITEHNAQLVQSRQYGRWVPQEFFARRAPAHLRRLEQEQMWMFAPAVAERKVAGFKARVSVPIMEGYSEVFDFSADFLRAYHGAQVKLYFNPFAPECIATVVLAQNFNGKKAGTVLGHAEQINRMARFRRRALGYGSDPDIGLDAAKRNAQALRRSVVAIRTDGSAGTQSHDARNGAGQGETVTNDPRLTKAPAPLRSERLRAAAAGAEDDDFEAQSRRLEMTAGLNRTENLVSETDE